jgi:hypothetical protein
VSLHPLVPAAARALRETEDGLTLRELGARIGTRWPERVVRGMQRDGYVLGEQHGRLYLVVDVDDGRRVAPKAGSLSPVSGLGGPAAVVNVDTPTLFQAQHHPLSPYDPMSEAA